MNPNDGEEKSKLDRVRNSLYSPKTKFTTDIPRNTFDEVDFNTKTDWKQPDFSEMKSPSSQRGSWLKTFFIASILFFIVSASIASYIFFAGGNTISSAKIDILVAGPTSVPGGKTLPLDISIKNNNTVALEQASLIVTFPPGTRSENNLSTEYVRATEDIGTIAAGASVRKSVTAVLFGEKDDIKTITVSLTYKARSSNAVLKKDKTYDVAINSSPINIAVDAVSEISSNQDVKFVATISSNSSAKIDNLLLRADTPPGFIFKNANPKADFDNTIWTIGSLKPEESRKIEFTGTIEGQDNDEKIFVFHTGVKTATDEKIIAADFVSVMHSIAIKKPFIGATIVLDGDTAQNHVARLGQNVQGKIGWFNNTQMPVSDVEVSLKFGGNLFDRASISSENGFFRSLDNTLIWNQNNAPALAQVASGGSGQFNFVFSLKRPTLDLVNTLRNPSMTVGVSVKGKRMSGSGLPEEVNSVDVKTIKIATDLALTSKTFFYSGAFKNTGSVPARAEKPTTYTIVWTVSNSYNNVSGGLVSAELPEYVRWVGVTSPSGEQVQFNPIGNKIQWTVGSVQAGAGKTVSPREVSFQVEITPSISQIGTTPILVRNMEIVGRDDFTGMPVGSSPKDSTVDISSDPKSSSDDYLIKK
ncbi:MAG: hypothetical protein WC757_01265 [Candidatus Paceibacterota bacterium]|jgi:hypothetical protein